MRQHEMNVATAPSPRDFVSLSRRFLDVLGADGLGDDIDQRRLVVDGIEPAWVLLPATVTEAGAALRGCAEHDLAVVPAGTGLRLGYGSVPERVDAVLSTSRMTAIVEHAAADLTLTVEAGATLAAVNEHLAPYGQWLPFDPPRAAETTIGGLVAANAAGPSRLAFGTVRESLIGIRALLADGTLVKSGGRVVKNVAGYDVQKLLVGSLGTLGVIVEATFKLQPRPRTMKIVGWRGAGLVELVRAGLRLADATNPPRAVEVSFGGGDPILVAELGGEYDEIADAERKAAEIVASLGYDRRDDGAAEAALRAIREPADPRGDSVVLRAGTRRDRLDAWLGTALARAGSVAASMRGHAHAGIGVARVELEAAEREPAAMLVAALRDEARCSGGYLVVERAPAAWKPALDVWGPPPAGFHLMKGIKAAFDPRRLLAPGRFVGNL
jgi:glycolate oxidase FAD binding subunit